MRLVFLSVALIILSFVGCGDVVPQQSIQAVKNGQRLYELHCTNCHQQDGAGLANLIPALNNLQSNTFTVAEIACAIKHGKGGIWNGSAYIKQSMPANAKLTTKEITYIINYVEWYFLKKTDIATDVQVQEALNACNTTVNIKN